MRARVWSDPVTDRVNVILELAPEVYAVNLDPNDRRVAQVKPGEEAPIVLSLQTHEWEVILREALRERPLDASASDAIRDARDTRDRLLAMIEMKWPDMS